MRTRVAVLFLALFFAGCATIRPATENEIAACKAAKAVRIGTLKFFEGIDILDKDGNASPFNPAEKMPENAERFKFVGIRVDELAMRTTAAFKKQLEESLQARGIPISDTATEYRIEASLTYIKSPVLVAQELRFLIINSAVLPAAKGERMAQSLLTAGSPLAVWKILPSDEIGARERHARALAEKFARETAVPFLCGSRDSTSK